MVVTELDPVSGSNSSTSTPSFLLLTDSSLTGWQVHLYELTAAEEWLNLESEKHIDTLEMRAFQITVTAFWERTFV